MLKWLQVPSRLPEWYEDPSRLIACIVYIVTGWLIFNKTITDNDNIENWSLSNMYNLRATKRTNKIQKIRATIFESIGPSHQGAHPPSSPRMSMSAHSSSWLPKTMSDRATRAMRSAVQCSTTKALDRFTASLCPVQGAAGYWYKFKKLISFSF